MRCINVPAATNPCFVSEFVLKLNALACVLQNFLNPSHMGPSWPKGAPKFVLGFLRSLIPPSSCSGLLDGDLAASSAASCDADGERTCELDTDSDGASAGFASGAAAAVGSLDRVVSKSPHTSPDKQISSTYKTFSSR